MQFTVTEWTLQTDEPRLPFTNLPNHRFTPEETFTCNKTAHFFHLEEILTPPSVDCRSDFYLPPKKNDAQLVSPATCVSLLLEKCAPLYASCFSVWLRSKLKRENIRVYIAVAVKFRAGQFSIASSSLFYSEPKQLITKVALIRPLKASKPGI